ncbi:hypothetical protein IQ264_30475 [Phormidium sp. LEGE 05292]|uniref:CheR family methyltransferase n=1 Tax=[Phormidium] sp. LEGE 05292 TaxID=767427 RepID=UPI00187EED7F|nr:CheR family methyltransferase [Phormidium sp. LEGE 05292]MBE9229732.1 hypothetical protein [Phormidium sp. LEGE 05292]
MIDLVSQEYKKLVFKSFVQIGALTLSVEEFIDIVFPNFANEIESEILKIAESLQIADVWVNIKNIIDANEFEHPLMIALYKNELLREIIGPEYSFIDRYPKVYDRIFREILPYLIEKFNTNKENADDSTYLSIGLIGASYGQELITILKYLFPYLSKTENSEKTALNIDVLNKPNIIFDKLKNNNLIYPKTVISKYMSPEELQFYFRELDSEYLYFSDLIFKQIRFINLNLLDKNNLEEFEAKKYNLIFLHNVIQYLEPKKGEDLNFICQFLDSILYEGGIISIINESKVINSHITNSFEHLYKLSGLYSEEKVCKASIYKKNYY